MPAVQKEILLQFFLGSPISVIDSLDYLTICRVRHRRPRHAASTAADFLRPRRCRHQMVRVIPERPDAARANTGDHHVAAITCRAWSPSRIGPRTDPSSAVRLRPAEADQTSPAAPRAYADDTQIYGFCQPSDVNALADKSVRLLQ